jgi:hypothetical protein
MLSAAIRAEAAAAEMMNLRMACLQGLSGPGQHGFGLAFTHAPCPGKYDRICDLRHSEIGEFAPFGIGGHRCSLSPELPAGRAEVPRFSAATVMLSAGNDSGP